MTVRKVLSLLLMLVAFLIFANCSDEFKQENSETIDGVIQDQNYDFANLISEELNIDAKTVDLKSSMDNLKYTIAQSKTKKNEDFINLQIDYNSVRLKEMPDTQVKAAVIDAQTDFEDIHSEIIQVEFNGVIQTVVKHEFEDSYDPETDLYNGIVVYTDLNGIVTNAYWVKNNEVIYEILKPEVEDSNTNGDGSKSGLPEGSKMPDPTPCWGYHCITWTLPEVTVTYHTPVQYRTVGPPFSNQGRAYATTSRMYSGMAAGYSSYLTYQKQMDAWTNGNVAIIEAGTGGVITDINDYIKCFDKSKGAELTIYIDQPVNGQPNTWIDKDPSIGGVDPEVGHTFISITQGGITRVLGFYPATGVKPKDSPQDVSILIDDSGHSFDVSITRTISPSELSILLHRVNNFRPIYDLNNYNCTDFAVQCGNAAGMGLPSSYGSWPLGGGDNPGVLGEKVRNLSNSNNRTINKNGGKSKSNKGGC